MTQTTHRNAGMLTIIGMESSIRKVVTVAGSNQDPCLWAIKNPSGIPIPTLTTIAARFTWNDTHILDAMREPTERPLNL